MRYLLILLLMLAACDERGGAMARTDRTVTMVAITWSENVDADCRAIGGKSHAGIAGCTVMESTPCKVIARKPDSWFDVDALTIIGHEFMHCLGYTHK